MKYIATYKDKPLSAFFPNGNGTVKDMISFSQKSFALFNSHTEINDYLNYHSNYLQSRSGIDKSLVDKVLAIVNKIKILPYNP